MFVCACHASALLHWYLHKRRTALYARYPAVDPQTKVKPGYRGQAAVRRLCRYLLTQIHSRLKRIQRINNIP
jgi:hypothetical protein